VHFKHQAPKLASGMSIIKEPVTIHADKAGDLDLTLQSTVIKYKQFKIVWHKGF